MKRYAIAGISFIALSLTGLLSSTASAQYPQRIVASGPRIAAGPQVVIVNGGYGGYGYGAGGYGAGGYGALGYGYGAYGGYGAPYYPPSAPYGAGYSGGWQPYQQMYYQRQYYGLGF